MTAAAASDLDCEQDFINKSLGRISTHAGVYGLLIVHPMHDRILHKSGFANSDELCVRWQRSLIAFVGVAASTVRTLDHTDDLSFLRMQWRNKHIIICPDPNREYVIIVVQDQVHQAAPEGGADAVIEFALNNTGFSGADATVTNLGATQLPNANTAAAAAAG